MLLVWTPTTERRIMLGSTTSKTYNIRLPAGHGNKSAVDVIVQIRDNLHCVTEFNITNISVVPVYEEINSFINTIKISSTSSNASMVNNDDLAKVLENGSPEVASQVVTTVSQVLNEMNLQSIKSGIESSLKKNHVVLTTNCISCIAGIPAPSISISPLGGSKIPIVSPIYQFYHKVKLYFNSHRIH